MPAHPRILLAIYIPLIVVAAVLAAIYMDNISSVRNDTGAFKESIREHHTWIMAFLYIGTFGSFIGYSFAFGLVLQNQFGRTPLQAASITFIGPLLGSLIRPVGGKLADRFGGAKVTFVNFIGDGRRLGGRPRRVGRASRSRSTRWASSLLFVLTGVGNGSTYKMIPAIFRGKATAAIARGGDERAQLMRARRISGAAIGIIGAVGALGGVLINMAFRQSFLTAKTGDPAFWAFIAFYVVCIAVTYVVYLRPAPVDVAHPRAGLRAGVTRTGVATPPRKHGGPEPVTGGDDHGGRCRRAFRPFGWRGPCGGNSLRRRRRRHPSERTV